MSKRFLVTTFMLLFGSRSYTSFDKQQAKYFRGQFNLMSPACPYIRPHVRNNNNNILILG